MTAMPSTPGSRLGTTTSTPRPGGVVIAAVELHTDPPPPPLALRVLRTASALADLSGSELHVVTAWELVGESILSCPIRGVSPARLRLLIRRTGEALEERVSARCEEALGHDRAQVHLVHGDPKAVIPIMSRRLRADLVVMGVADRPRHRWFPERPLIRDTAGRIDCDLLALRSPPESDSDLFLGAR